MSKETDLLDGVDNIFFKPVFFILVNIIALLLFPFWKIINKNNDNIGFTSYKDC